MFCVVMSETKMTNKKQRKVSRVCREGAGAFFHAQANLRNDCGSLMLCLVLLNHHLLQGSATASCSMLTYDFIGHKEVITVF